MSPRRESRPSLKWDEGKTIVSALVHSFGGKFRIYALHHPLMFSKS